MRIETLAIHAGRRIEPASGGVAASLHLATTFERAEDGTYPKGHIYSRESQPNRSDLEQCLATLEGGATAAAFATGSAATATLLQALAPGDHVIAPDDVFYGTRTLLTETFGAWGLEASFVDMADLDAIEQAIRPNTRLVWLETPSNPMLGIADIPAIAAITAIAQRGKAHGALTLVDNTWATPILQRPLTLGADLVLHSTTKYLGGHCDVLGGALVAREESPLFARVRRLQASAGAGASAFDSWLVLRGVRTLPARMRVHGENAARLAAFLADHPAVEKVYYPGLADHPGHEIAKRQMSGFGGMLSFVVPGGRARAFEVASKVKVFTRATSLGGVESLVEHRASVEGANTRAPEGLLRVSVGLEHPDDLIEDLAQALR
jgi:cystathionine gamma-synthase